VNQFLHREVGFQRESRRAEVARVGPFAVVDSRVKSQAPSGGETGAAVVATMRFASRQFELRALLLIGGFKIGAKSRDFDLRFCCL